MKDALLALLAGRRGHFQMESGYHSDLWFELDRLFADPARVQPFAAELAARLAKHRIDAVVGPEFGGARLGELIARELDLESYAAVRVAPTRETSAVFPVRYILPEAQRARLAGKSVAIVDDAISAGSAVRGTFEDLIACGARPVVLGALIVFGNRAGPLAAERNLALERIAECAFNLWAPHKCPLCRRGVPVERVSDVA